MSATIQARDLVVSLGPAEILGGVSLSVSPGQRLGVVGPNGVGKSTLLKALAGLVRPEQGSVTLAPPRATVGYLPQEPDRREGETVLDFLGRRTGVTAALREMDTTTQALAAGRPGADDAYVDALERWLGLGGGDLDARAERTLAELGIGAELVARSTAVLSGGEAARVSLAGILLSRFDVLLLDEPTNDLDFDGLTRLEDFVRGVDATLVVVSHDRAFLDHVVTDVVELDEHSRTATAYGGGWAAYLAARSVTRRHAEEDFSAYETRRDVLQARAQRQRLWSRQGVQKVKAKKAREKDKLVQAHDVATSEKVAAKARASERALERLEVVEKPWQDWELRFTIAEARRSGEVVARLDQVVVGRGDFRLGPVDLLVRWAERLAIVGPNGSGKTTLVDTILQRVRPVSGTAWLGPGVVVGELEQGRGRFLGDGPLLDGFAEDSGLLPGEARTLLAKFSLGAAHVARQSGSLSPGERTRASLALFQARGVNTLVLDEPTNHLDLPAIGQLERALEGFHGTILLITHDRRLLERFDATRTLEVRDGAVRTLDEAGGG